MNQKKKKREFGEYIGEYLVKNIVDTLKENSEKTWWTHTFWDLYVKASFYPENITIREIYNLIIDYNCHVKDLFR